MNPGREVAQGTEDGSRGFMYWEQYNQFIVGAVQRSRGGLTRGNIREAAGVLILKDIKEMEFSSSSKRNIEENPGCRARWNRWRGMISSIL